MDWLSEEFRAQVGKFAIRVKYILKLIHIGKDQIKCMKHIPKISTHSLPYHTKELNEQNKDREEGWVLMTLLNNIFMNSALPLLTSGSQPDSSLKPASSVHPLTITICQ